MVTFSAQSHSNEDFEFFEPPRKRHKEKLPEERRSQQEVVNKRPKEKKEDKEPKKHKPLTEGILPDLELHQCWLKIAENDIVIAHKYAFVELNSTFLGALRLISCWAELPVN